MIGGEVYVWGSNIDETNLIQRVWLKASAVAERLWSKADNFEEDFGSAETRLEEHRCKLLQRGFPVEPLGPSYCRHGSIYNGLRNFYLENFIYD